MYKPVTKDIKRKLCLAQLALTIISMLACFFWGSAAVVGAALGGATVIITNQVLAYFCFRYQGAKLANQVVASFFLGAVSKMLLTGMIFVAIFSYLPWVNLLALICAVLVVQICGTLIAGTMHHGTVANR